jgi:hypothetical protein
METPARATSNLALTADAFGFNLKYVFYHISINILLHVQGKKKFKLFQQ